MQQYETEQRAESERADRGEHGSSSAKDENKPEGHRVILSFEVVAQTPMG